MKIGMKEEEIAPKTRRLKTKSGAFTATKKVSVIGVVNTVDKSRNFTKPNALLARDATPNKIAADVMVLDCPLSSFLIIILYCDIRL